MATVTEVMENFFELFEVEEEKRKGYANIDAYQELMKKGIPYKIYLRIHGGVDSDFQDNECYLELGASECVDDLKLRLCFKGVADYIHDVKQDIHSHKYGGFLNVDRTRNSVSAKAVPEAVAYVKAKMDDKYEKIMEYGKFRFPTESDIANLQREEKAFIYPVYTVNAYYDLTYNNNGNKTCASLIIGIPFDIK